MNFYLIFNIHKGELKMEQLHVGNTSQLFDVKQYRLVGGKADGVRAIDVWNGGDLSFTLIADRALDLFTVRYCGHNLSFLSPTGVVDPAYYDDQNIGWLNSFGGGFLCTCGLQNIGSPDADHGLHGRISNTPAENVCVELADDGCSVKISGIMREARLFGTKLQLKREIYCEKGSDVIRFTDTVTNLGFNRERISMLYHFNMGYPLVSESAKPYIPAIKSVPRNEHAATEPDWSVVHAPTAGFEEMCWYHFLSEKVLGIDNPAIDTSMRIKFDSPILDRALQWRMFGQGDYVMGLEPASSSIDGIDDAIANGSMKYIEPRSSIVNKFEISFKHLSK